MRINDQLSDAAVLSEIGERLAGWRLERNLSQTEFAAMAGIARRTVQRLEDGESVQLPSFIRVLRALGMIDALDRLVPEAAPSPVERLSTGGRRRQRARTRRTEDSPQEPWVWGDEQSDEQ
ncbi:MAG: helix-turn-helix domain-containing protein [Solirubrobacterales bacterium]